VLTSLSRLFLLLTYSIKRKHKVFHGPLDPERARHVARALVVEPAVREVHGHEGADALYGGAEDPGGT
jgi:hypothetical protein